LRLEDEKGREREGHDRAHGEECEGGDKTALVGGQAEGSKSGSTRQRRTQPVRTPLVGWAHRLDASENALETVRRRIARCSQKERLLDPLEVGQERAASGAVADVSVVRFPPRARDLTEVQEG